MDQSGSLSSASTLLDLLREHAALGQHLPASTVMLAEALLSLGPESADRREAVYELGRALVMNGQARRAVHLLRKHDVLAHDARALLLAASALLDMKELEAGLDLLPDNFKAPEQGLSLPLHAALYVTRGKLLDASDQPARAADAYKQALLVYPLCYEALEILADRCLLPPDQLKELYLNVRSVLPLELGSIRALYDVKMQQHLRLPDKGTEIQPVDIAPGSLPLEHNLTYMAAEAEHMFHQGRLQDCYRITTHVLNEDPHREGSLLWLHTSILVELGKRRELFAWAHAVAQRCPGKAEAWYAVGCYYLATHKLESARTYLSRATTLAKPAESGPAWLAFGRAFSEQGEQDQAMAAYRTAHRCMPYSYIPLLCMGSELIRAHNFNLARQYLRQARGFGGGNGFVWNELGVVSYRNKEYAKAAKQLERALWLWRERGGSPWADETGAAQAPPCAGTDEWEETLLLNLGHAHRKLGRYDAAISCFEQALALGDSAEAHAALAFTHHLRGDLECAIQGYHNTLTLVPHHAFSLSMLSCALTAAPLPLVDGFHPRDQGGLASSPLSSRTPIPHPPSIPVDRPSSHT